MRRITTLTLLCVVGMLVLVPVAFAQASFCTTSVDASGESVARCVEAPSPTPAASPEATVISGGPLTASGTATGTIAASGSAAVVAAVGGVLPPTGGGKLAVVAAALLLGSGVLSFAVVRRGG